MSAAISIKNQRTRFRYSDPQAQKILLRGYENVEKQAGYDEMKYRRGLIRGLRNLDSALARGYTLGQAVIVLVLRDRPNFHL